MKQIKFLAALALVAAISLPAMAEMKVTFSGSAKARFGSQYMKVDKDSLQARAFLAALEENAPLAVMLAALTTDNTNVALLKAVYLDNAIISAESIPSIVTPLGPLTVLELVNNTLALQGSTYQYTEASLIRAIKDYRKAKVDALFVGLKKEQATRLDIKIEDDKLTFKIGAELLADLSGNSPAEDQPLDLKVASASYDFGIGAITYSDAGMQGRWNADIFYVGDANKGKSSLDFTVKPGENMGNAFFTLMSNKALSSSVKYENTRDRVIPIMQLGYEYKSDMLDVRAGGVYDKYKGGTNDNDYVGYLGFGTATVKIGDPSKLDGDMSLFFSASGIYGQNVSAFAGMKASDLESATISLSAFTVSENPLKAPNTVSKSGKENSKVWGAIAGFGITPWKGALIYTDYRYSKLSLANTKDPFDAMKAQLAVTQFLSKNFYILLGGGYEAYAGEPDKSLDRAWGWEATVETGYRF